MLDFGEKGCFLELTLSVYVTQSASAAKYAISTMLTGAGIALLILHFENHRQAPTPGSM